MSLSFHSCLLYQNNSLFVMFSPGLQLINVVFVFCRIMYRELKDSDKERESGKMVMTRF